MLVMVTSSGPAASAPAFRVCGFRFTNSSHCPPLPRLFLEQSRRHRRDSGYILIGLGIQQFGMLVEISDIDVAVSKVLFVQHAQMKSRAGFDTYNVQFA